MKDVWGTELVVGDQVCVVRKIGRYTVTTFGQIIGFTPSGTMARIRDNKSGPFPEFRASERIFKKPNVNT